MERALSEQVSAEEARENKKVDGSAGRRKRRYPQSGNFAEFTDFRKMVEIVSSKSQKVPASASPQSQRVIARSKTPKVAASVSSKCLEFTIRFSPG